jgi:hypothetical protein
MAVPSAIKYRREFIGAFNTSVSLIKDWCTPESMDHGSSAVFDVSAVGGRMASRSIDGRIPRTNVSDTQVTCTLNEYVKKFEVTDFEAFESQSDERAKMNHRVMESTNQEIDYNIITELANATTSFSATAAPITLDTATRTIATLAANQVPINAAECVWVVSPFMEAKLQNISGYASQDYVSGRPLETGGNQFSNQVQIKRWLNVSWIVHPNLPGVGTSSCTTYLWHKKAIGCAIPTNQIRYSAGYDDQDHYHYCSATLKAGTKILQNAGILKFLHNDEA